MNTLHRLTENKDAHKRVLPDGKPIDISILPGVPVNCIVEAEAGYPYKISLSYCDKGDLMVYTSFHEKFPDRNTCS